MSILEGLLHKLGASATIDLLRADDNVVKRTAQRYRQKVASGVFMLRDAQGNLSAVPMILRRNYRVGKEWTVADGCREMDLLFPIKHRTRRYGEFYSEDNT